MEKIVDKSKVVKIDYESLCRNPSGFIRDVITKLKDLQEAPDLLVVPESEERVSSSCLSAPIQSRHGEHVTEPLCEGIHSKGGITFGASGACAGDK